MNVPSVPAGEEKTRAGVAVRVTLNPEMDRVVICVGDDAVGLTYEDALVMGQQLATVLKLMHEERAKPNVKQ
jgi:hypothetical protein